MKGLEVRLRLDRGNFHLAVDLELPASGITGLFGPSGSGKTTLLRCLAGLDVASDGLVRLAGEAWQDGRAGTFLPVHRRGVGFVFQEPDLFPHLSVRGNLEFAYKRAPERRIAWDDAVAWLGLGPLLDRSPRGLSGGERQRVALARALLSSPQLLLMDEPLSALDEVGRREIFPYLQTFAERLQIPAIYVSHSLSEVARLSDRMVWLVQGRVRAVGPVAEVLGRLDFAEWRGEEATVVVDTVVLEHDEAYGLTLLQGPWGPLWVGQREWAPGCRIRVQIRAVDVSLSLVSEQATSILNHFPLRVLQIQETSPGEVLISLESRTGGGPILLARIMRRSRDRLDLERGREVWARVKAVAVVA